MCLYLHRSTRTHREIRIGRDKVLRRKQKKILPSVSYVVMREVCRARAIGIEAKTYVEFLSSG